VLTRLAKQPTSPPMRSRRRYLWLVLLAPAALIYGCRSTPRWVGDTFFETAVDTAFNAVGSAILPETPEEREERQWRELREP
jgi:hypothetical protein